MSAWPVEEKTGHRLLTLFGEIIRGRRGSSVRYQVVDRSWNEDTQHRREPVATSYNMWREQERKLCGCKPLRRPLCLVYYSSKLTNTGHIK